MQPIVAATATEFGFAAAVFEYGSAVHPTVQRLSAAYQAALGQAPRVARLAAWVLAFAVAALVARLGTSEARVAAWALGASASGLFAWGFLRERSANRDTLRAIQGVLRRVSPTEAARVERAYQLSQQLQIAQLQTAPPPQSRDGASLTGESPELARAFLEQTLGKFELASVERFAREQAGTWRGIAAVLCLAVFVLVSARPFQLLEGLVLFASPGRVAPIEMEWLEDVEITAKPPSYLSLPFRPLEMESVNLLPEGSVVSVQGRPLHEGREIGVTDGEQFVPFADDGHGARVAHWPIAGSAVLRVAARFGSSLILSPSVLEVHADPDRSPGVRLQGAPKQFSLVDLTELPLLWQAWDDHALSQVDLVLRTGGKEERRPLAHFASNEASGTGGHVLYPDDPFFSRAFLPVTVRIEARDNDTRAGSKWGASEVFTLVPPSTGTRQASRIRALTEIRDTLVQFLVKQFFESTSKALATKLPAVKIPGADPAVALLRPAPGAKPYTSSDIRQLESQALAVANRAEVNLPRGWPAFSAAQFQRLQRAAQEPSAKASGIEKQRVVLENVILALDAALASLANRDAAKVSTLLADVAEEAALAAHLGQQGETDRSVAEERLNLALLALQTGALELSELGVLGGDLGSVALADTGRIAAARAVSDFFHAELAALHLAARLRRPTPSFGAKGGGGGVESGTGQSDESSQDPQGSTSDEAAEFDRMAEQVAELAEEHAEAIDRTDRALEAAKEVGRDASLAAEAQRRGEALRRAVSGLPQPGEDPGTSGASAALAREHSTAMAHELEGLAFERAVESGARARSAAAEALRRGALPEEDVAQLTQLGRLLEEQLSWAREQAERQQASAEAAAKSTLEELARLEAELSERAGRLGREGQAHSSAKKKGVALPQEMVKRLSEAHQRMQQATDALRSGKGEQAANLQRDAQRYLEEADTGKTGSSEGDSAQAGGKGEPGDSPGDSRKPTPGGAVVIKDEAARADEFRKRVVSGLSKQGSGGLSGAVKRYAEGLLR